MKICSIQFPCFAFSGDFMLDESECITWTIKLPREMKKIEWSSPKESPLACKSFSTWVFLPTFSLTCPRSSCELPGIFSGMHRCRMLSYFRIKGQSQLSALWSVQKNTYIWKLIEESANPTNIWKLIYDPMAACTSWSLILWPKNWLIS